jgi:hypothetical protein
MVLFENPWENTDMFEIFLTKNVFDSIFFSKEKPRLVSFQHLKHEKKTWF